MILKSIFSIRLYLLFIFTEKNNDLKLAKALSKFQTLLKDTVFYL